MKRSLSQPDDAPWWSCPVPGCKYKVLPNIINKSTAKRRHETKHRNAIDGHGVSNSQESSPSVADLLSRGGARGEEEPNANALPVIPLGFSQDLLPDAPLHEDASLEPTSPANGVDFDMTSRNEHEEAAGLAGEAQPVWMDSHHHGHWEVIHCSFSRKSWIQRSRPHS